MTRRLLSGMLCVWGLFVVEQGAYRPQGTFATKGECQTAMQWHPQTAAVCVDMQQFIAKYFNTSPHVKETK